MLHDLGHLVDARATLVSAQTQRASLALSSRPPAGELPLAGPALPPPLDSTIADKQLRFRVELQRREALSTGELAQELRQFFRSLCPPFFSGLTAYVRRKPTKKFRFRTAHNRPSRAQEFIPSYPHAARWRLRHRSAPALLLCG